MKDNLLKAILIIVIGLALCARSIAQKLPNEQKESVYAPSGIKIDGKATEWGQFKALNKATLLNYTLSNDEENLYLVLRSDDRTAIGKTFYGGISVVIKPRGKGSKAGQVMVTYPQVTETQRSEIVIPLRDKEAKTDSVVQAVNQRIPTFAKQIAIKGIKDIEEDSISVYNEHGIKASVQFDQQRAMVIEYQIPLKYIRSMIDTNGTFDYIVIMNGAKLPPNTIVVSGHQLGGVSAVNIAPSGGSGMDVFSPTDISSTYTLAKK